MANHLMITEMSPVKRITTFSDIYGLIPAEKSNRSDTWWREESLERICEYQRVKPKEQKAYLD